AEPIGEIAMGWQTGAAGEPSSLNIGGECVGNGDVAGAAAAIKVGSPYCHGDKVSIDQRDTSIVPVVSSQMRHSLTGLEDCMGTIRRSAALAEGSAGRRAYRLGSAAADLVPAAFYLLLSWMDLARQRRALQALDDSLLRDIGLSRADVEAETSK